MNKQLFSQYYFSACLIIYIILGLAIPPNKAVLKQYHLTVIQAHLLSLAVFIPVIAIWCMSYYGYHRLSQYTTLIAKTKDGKQIRGITRGVKILALGAPTVAIITACLNYGAQQHPNWLTSVTVLNNYFTLVVPLVAFTLIGMVARKLSGQINRPPSQWLTNVLLISFAVISVMYCYFIFSNSSITTIYRLPLSALTLTIILPYVFMWYTGLLGVVDLLVYSGKATGVLYRKGWRWVAGGFAMVILSSISIQYTTTLTQRLLRLTVGPVLLVIYGLLIILGIGYVLIAHGARKLQKMEEV